MSNKVMINKQHGGKQFMSKFVYAGRASQVETKENDQWVKVPFLTESKTKAGNDSKTFQFSIETAERHKIKVEKFGQVNKEATLKSRGKDNVKIEWKDRKNKAKYPDDTYYLDTDYDKLDDYAELVKDGEWYEVKGHYESNRSSNGKLYLKRVIDSIKEIKTGDTIKLVTMRANSGDEFITDFVHENYICDFNDPNFKEVNFFTMPAGVKSAYYDENANEVKLNAVLMAYGKERSIPKDIEFVIPYPKEVSEGETPLAELFKNIPPNYIVDVVGIDHSYRGIKETILQEVEVDTSDDPFARSSQVKVQKQVSVNAGRKSYLEITDTVEGTFIKNAFEEWELEPVGEIYRQQEHKNEDPFSQDGKSMEIDDELLPF